MQRRVNRRLRVKILLLHSNTDKKIVGSYQSIVHSECDRNRIQFWIYVKIQFKFTFTLQLSNFFPCIEENTSTPAERVCEREIPLVWMKRIAIHSRTQHKSLSSDLVFVNSFAREVQWPNFALTHLRSAAEKYISVFRSFEHFYSVVVLDVFVFLAWLEWHFYTTYNTS